MYETTITPVQFVGGNGTVCLLFCISAEDGNRNCY